MLKSHRNKLLDFRLITLHLCKELEFSKPWNLYIDIYFTKKAGTEMLTNLFETLYF